MRPWGHSDMEALQYTEEELDAMSAAAEAKDKVVKWSLPVEIDGPSGEYFITFPDDLLEAADLKEGDQVEWIDQGDGSYLMKNVENKQHPSWVKGNELAKVKTYQEMIDDGWSMTDDGFWIKDN
jgi:bifunctional DNA-binding transcriptional regulator/antitoxin component of YhaV-PrlF toxin-antitoxin module